MFYLLLILEWPISSNSTNANSDRGDSDQSYQSYEETMEEEKKIISRGKDWALAFEILRKE